MQNEFRIEIYNFESQSLRITGSFEEPLFAVKDICNVLGLSNVTEAVRNIPDKWKRVQKFLTLRSGEQDMITVTESGLYKMVMRSTKPVAEKFQEWICEEVLPSIRKKGEYVLTEYKEKIEKQKKEIENQKIENQKKQLALEEAREKEEKQKKEIENQKIETQKKQLALEEAQKKDQAQKDRIELLEMKVLCQRRRLQPGINVVYLVTSPSNKHKRIYIVGKAVVLKERITGYNKIEEHEVIYYVEFKSREEMMVAESMVLRKLENFRQVKNRDRFILPETRNIKFFTDVYDMCNDFFNPKDDQYLLEPQIPLGINENIGSTALVKFQEKIIVTQQIDKENNLSVPILNKTSAIPTRIKTEVKKNNRIDYIRTYKNYIILRNKIYRQKNIERLRMIRKEYYRDNKDKLLLQSKNYYYKNKKKYSDRWKKYYRKNIEKMLIRNKIYHDANREVIKTKARKKYRENAILYRHKAKEWRQKNLEKAREIGRRAYHNNAQKNIERNRKYKLEHRDELLIKDKERYHANKTEINEKRKVKVQCECGLLLAKSSLSGHKKSKKHLEILSNK